MRRHAYCCLGALIGLWLGAADAAPFRAGVSRIDVTPPAFPVSMVGSFTDRKATAAHDPLAVRCLVLDDGALRVAIAVVDVCILPRELCQAAKRAAAQASGIRPEHILLSSTHTHTAPPTTVLNDIPVDPAYVELLTKKIAQAVADACRQLVPVQVGWGITPVPNEVFNRRWFMKDGTLPANPFGNVDRVQMNPGVGNPNLVKPAGPTDPNVSVLSLHALDGRAVALLGNYSLHYVGDVPPAQLSADYFGEFCRQVESRLGRPGKSSSPLALLTNGTSGDVNNVDCRNPRPRGEAFSQIRRVAGAIADAALAAAARAEHRPQVSLAMCETELELAVRKPDAEGLKRARAILAQPDDKGLPRLARYYAQQALRLSAYPDTVRLTVQALRIGELGIVAIPCEVFAEIGLEIKRRSPFSSTFVISLANGYNGYLPTPAQHALGGYETWAATSSYLEPRASCKIADAAVDLLRKMQAAPDSLATEFRQPPPAARPWVYWFVMDGNLTREGITADFEALQRAGIGGLIFMEVNVGVPQGSVKFMSPQWRQLMAHAIHEAQRLGLEMTLNAGPGWTGSGGPWVRPEQSMQHLVASAVEVAGPQRYDAVLPRPTPRPAYFGNAGLSAEMLKAKDEFYADVAVLAFPTPAAGASLDDIDEKALYLRHPYSSRPGTKPFLPSPAVHLAVPAGMAIARERIVDLTAQCKADGHLTWDVPPGKWTILRYGRTSTGANTRPAPAPGLGWECDKMDPVALDAHFEAFVGALLREVGPRQPSDTAGWTSLHIDSWEMGAQNWTARFREEFRRRRGYDPLLYLPTITGRVVESREISERFLWDLRQTAQELVIANHAQHLKELGRRHGLRLSIEPYDMNPCADLSLGAVADVPMCEFWLYGFESWFSVIEAASIAHTGGRNVVAAESFTSSAAERWQAHPASMKTLGDWAFASGVNRVVFHRYQHQPWLDRRPGMTMGPYGVHWDRTQTWWELTPAYHAYLARCQHMLRRGLPVVDVCFLAAEGAPHVFRAPASAVQGKPPDPRSYRFDACAPDTLLTRMAVSDGRLTLPDGMSYRLLVLPERDTMTPAVLRKVKELVAAGATVIGPRPSKSPSLSQYPQCDAEVARLAAEVWGDCDGLRVQQHPLGKGRVVWQRQPEATAPGNQPHAIMQAQWIWSADARPALLAPVSRRFFRRTVVLEKGTRIANARAFMTADNSFELSINGRPVGGGDSFHHLENFDVTALLAPGANTIAVAADNGGDAPNPAGLIGTLVIELHEGRTLTIPTDRTWEAAATAQGAWQAAAVLGPADMAPWKLKGPPPPEPEQYGDFAVVEAELRKLGVAPDFESDGPLRCIHRREGAAEIYFVANREERRVEANCTFRVTGKTPELWDPLSGQIRELPQFTTHGDRTIVPLDLEAAQSFCVVFRKPVSARAAQGADNCVRLAPVAEVSASWEVGFDPKWGGPEKVRFEKLVDWTARPEPGIRYYSGMATYRNTFTWQPDDGYKDPRVFLDLGVVNNLARVAVNGRDLGVIWCAPWRVEITTALRTGENRLEITVANLWPNRLIGDQSLPEDQRLTWTTWNPFKKDSPLLPSGLLGPVRLCVPVTAQPRTLK